MSNANLPFETENSEVAAAPGFRLGLGSIVLLIGILMIAVVFGVALLQRNQTQPQAGAAPDFTLTTLDGQTYRLADLKGQVVVINFWASWCQPCRVEAAELQRVWDKYKDQGVTFLGVAYTDTERGAKAFINEFSQTYPNGLDIGTKISDLYNIQGVPETFIVNQKGEVVEFIMQQVNEAELSALLDRVLATGA
ncbi:MAG TPA: TlpA disulfide reductase family protein [Phototrophicaceae bacterium]|nr:TlpA disulfide reductase family protein [Phototrophicaceae bacterium]